MNFFVILFFIFSPLFNQNALSVSVHYDLSRQRPIALPPSEHAYLENHWRDILRSGINPSHFEPLEKQKRNKEREFFLRSLTKFLKFFNTSATGVDIKTMEYFQNFDIYGSFVPEEVLPHLMVLATLEIIGFDEANLKSTVLKRMLAKHSMILRSGAIGPMTNFLDGIVRETDRDLFYAFTYIFTVVASGILLPHLVGEAELDLAGNIAFATTSSMATNYLVVRVPKMITDIIDIALRPEAISQAQVFPIINPSRLEDRAAWFGYGLLLENADLSSDNQLMQLANRVSELYSLILSADSPESLMAMLNMSHYPEEWQSYILLVAKAIHNASQEDT